ncbi:zinc-finger homeodomain protein 6-like [Phalaenopsis equestris]|uniref:zinc-finger homeodomain protein 6-like n=1 Tax=Phalaenopsis equestris TaxID=78828 RepID=UPI0009E5F62B|nr:zinc-finger homeodomain protein 6-like [Phalaenopsis equestris]
MDFRRQNDDDDDDETVSYNPPTIRDSAFPKPILPSSSSLIPGGTVPTIGVRNGMRSSSPDLSLAAESGKGEGSNFRTTGIAGEPSSLKYRECLRNHAASHGGHVLDGCGEFMPGSADTMKCAACGCHRSFHRREGESDHLFYRHHQHNGSNHSGGNRVAAGGRIPLLLPAPQLAPHQKHIHCFSPSPSAGMVAFGNTSGGTTTESSSEELGLTPAGAMPGGFHMPPFVTPSSKKRFRTKFTSEQKARMMDFAERIGWRIQRQDEVDLDAFCAEVGVSRQVFKVWMHNNKHSIRKQQEQQNRELQQPLQQP